MGFTTGLTGGVTVTLGAIYLTVLAHQRNRDTQSQLLRAQTHVLNSLIDPRPPLPPLSRAESAAQARANIVETAKDKWNHEIENAVRWVQRTDWDEVRENVEDKVAGLWGRAFRGATAAGDGTTRKVEAATVGITERAANAAATSTVDMAKSTSSQIVSRVSDRAAEAKRTLVSTVEKGLDQGKAMLNKETTGAAVVADRIASKAESDVEKALRQRYETRKGMDQSLEDVLKDRYTPVDRKDQSILRGL